VVAQLMRSSGARVATDLNDSPEYLVLDESERCLLGVLMTPLLLGEFKLLSYLGERSPTWHSTYSLSVAVYQRTDATARQLVWKYASTLRKKLAATHPELIELCRRRGYRCRQHIRTSACELGPVSGP
jgi:DNA-binding response OmpR family regulator